MPVKPVIEIGVINMQDVQLTNNNLLINEQQLGDQLGQAVAHQRGRDFSLLLAMLSQNVIDNAAFCLPRDNLGFIEVDEGLLRAQLGVCEPANLAIDEHSAVTSILLGVDLHTDGLQEIKLKGYLQPEPLAMHDDPLHINDQILYNCEPTTMERHLRQVEKLAEQLPHNEADLYEVLQAVHGRA